MKTSTPLRAPAPSALLNEVLTPLQWAASALQSPTLATAPKGNGSTVLVLPGFGASDASTAVMRTFLTYLGYNARGWGLGRNDGDVLALLDQLDKHVCELAGNGQIAIVGWSLGGYLAREIARQQPDRVRQVVTMGSPVVGGPKYTAVAQMFEGGGESLDTIEQLVQARYTVPLTVPVTAIYSKLDGVVAWQACIDHWSPNVEHVEITSTHAGFGGSTRAFRIMAERLAAPSAG